MIKNRVNTLVSKFKKYNIDGYIIPKNDEFFSEYSANDRLKNISNFSGSAGYSIILKKKNYLFVDGRYTIQAKKEAGKIFQIVDLHKIINCNLFKNLSIGFDPKFFTSTQIKKFFYKNNKVKRIESNLIDQIYQRKVKLNKPMQGDVKKFKVYVKDPKTGNVKKVNFGDPNMRIKKSNPKRRKSFRARHNCDNPGPKTKARYWSCRKW